MKEVLRSKKFLASLAGILVVLLNQLFGWEVSEATILQVVGLVAAYVVGQGIADNGKEKAKVEAASKNPYAELFGK